MFSSKQSVEAPALKIVQEVLGLLFASAHQLPIVGTPRKYYLIQLILSISQTLTFAIHSLCKHPECIQPLRMEIERMQQSGGRQDYENLPLLGSFLKESTRLNPIDCSKFRKLYAVKHAHKLS